MSYFTARRWATRLASLTLVAAPVALVTAAPAHASVPGSTAAVNTDEQHLALRGYDPVAYFDGGKPTPGDAAISATHDGATYYFAGEEHRAMFLAAPEQYLPQFGGFCVVAASFGEKVDADPETGVVIDGKLYVNFNAQVAKRFAADTANIIARAEENWPTVKDLPAR